MLPLVLVVAGGIIYHISQKSVPRGLNPLWAVAIAYALGIGLCVLLMVIGRGGVAPSGESGRWSWAVFGIGVGAVMIEVGFMLLYRAGIDLSIASVVANISVVLVLLPIGVLLLGERLTVRAVAGIICCLCGLVLLARR